MDYRPKIYHVKGNMQYQIIGLSENQRIRDSVKKHISEQGPEYQYIRQTSTLIY